MKCLNLSFLEFLLFYTFRVADVNPERRKQWISVPFRLIVHCSFIFSRRTWENAPINVGKSFIVIIDLYFLFLSQILTNEAHSTISFVLNKNVTAYEHSKNLLQTNSSKKSRIVFLQFS